ncbi:flavin-containing monooxygenase FMO GS-OX-like 3 [Rhodamnia argentea]|uniref:Flavin-containing monooxygenase n=1 Tax=Rhodamnia argentea TaxID=178133 RepID=A0A8B8PMT8_9MYRT|nr:flavin-containing monooxygenase FMO GS-OX-like 3 [Rhodamnia argentea]
MYKKKAMPKRSVKAAVIGAGMSGLVAARELRREGHQVVVFEKGSEVGGTWVYDPRVESDPLGLDPAREVVHSSMYKSLRVNLPRPIMGFSDYPFEAKLSVGVDPRPFPGHEEVLRFLQGFAEDSGVVELVRFEHEVVRVERVVEERNDEWVVEWQTRDGEVRAEVFEAVVVCNGKYTEPRLAEFPGRSTWGGEQIHSHNYRVPEPYKDKIVVIIGNGPSAVDIAKDILHVAKEVHLASRETTKFKIHDGLYQHSPIDYAEDNGKIVFRDGSSMRADAIIHCSGYKYHFPFLKTNGIVNVDDNRVEPLYKQVFPPALAPWLSFIAIPYRTIAILLSELQSRWVAKILSGKILLPSKEEMTSSVQEYYQRIEAVGWPRRHTHRLQLEKFDYENWLAGELGLPPLERWRQNMYFTSLNLLMMFGANLRDTWDVEKWMQGEGGEEEEEEEEEEEDNINCSLEC